jgi:hypothetical protein
MNLSTGHRGTAAALAGAVLLGGLAGCGAGHAVTRISHRGARNHPLASTLVAAGKGTVAAFIAKLQARPATPFAAKYLISGMDPPVVTYAVRPPGQLLFSESPIVGKGRRTRIVVNGSGEYRCTQRGTGAARWTCQQLSAASAAAQNKNLAVYTAAHWATFLKKVALAAAAKTTTFTMRADAPPTIGKGAHAGRMSCLGFRSAGTGISTICAAAPGILGSVILCRGPISFVLERYVTSPPASLFQLPPGAKIIKLGARAG